MGLNFHDNHFRINGMLRNAKNGCNRIMLLFVEHSRLDETLAEAQREDMLNAEWVWIVAHVPTGLSDAARYQLRNTNAFFFQTTPPAERDLINDALRLVSLAVDRICPPPAARPQTLQPPAATQSSAFTSAPSNATLYSEMSRTATGTLNQNKRGSAIPADSCAEHFKKTVAKSCDELSYSPHMYTRGLEFARYSMIWIMCELLAVFVKSNG